MTPPRRALVAVVLAGAGAIACRPVASHRTVDLRNLAFQPALVTVALGDTITWVNLDVVPHTASATDSTWDSGAIAGAGVFTRVADRRGSFSYACRYHPDMTGRLVVR